MSKQSIMDRVTAAKHSIAGQGLAKVVCKATTEEVMGPKKKHLDCKYQPSLEIISLCDTMLYRLVGLRGPRFCDARGLAEYFIWFVEDTLTPAGSSRPSLGVSVHRWCFSCKLMLTISHNWNMCLCFLLILKRKSEPLGVYIKNICGIFVWKGGPHLSLVQFWLTAVCGQESFTLENSLKKKEIVT